MLFLTTLKGITRDGSLETIAEMAHPGAGGDASAVCNRFQDVISSTPEGDALRARYAQVLFILDNQVRSQLEFPPPSAPEVAAASTGSGEGDLSGEGGTVCPHLQDLKEYLAKLSDEQIREAFERVGFAENATREEMVASVMDYVRGQYDQQKAHLETLSDEEIVTQARGAGIIFKEGTLRAEMITILLNGPTELPDTTKAGTGEGDLSGAKATPDEGPELPFGGAPGEKPSVDPPQGGETKPVEPSPGEASPGTMTPAKKKGK